MQLLRHTSRCRALTRAWLARRAFINKTAFIPLIQPTKQLCSAGARARPSHYAYGSTCIARDTCRSAPRRAQHRSARESRQPALVTSAPIATKNPAQEPPPFGCVYTTVHTRFYHMVRVAAAMAWLLAAASAEKLGRTCGNEGGASTTICSIPPWPATWQMNASTIIMPCNYTGFQVPSTIKGWGVVDFECDACLR